MRSSFGSALQHALSKESQVHVQVAKALQCLHSTVVNAASQYVNSFQAAHVK